MDNIDYWLFDSLTFVQNTQLFLCQIAGTL